MATTTSTILLKGDLFRRYEERKAAVTGIKPGHVVTVNSSGNFAKGLAGAGNISVGNVPPFTIAIEDGMQGCTTTDAYTQYDLVRAITLLPGEECNARLPANATSVPKGALLQHSTDGTLVLKTDGPAVAQAREGVNNSASASEAFIPVIVI